MVTGDHIIPEIAGSGALLLARKLQHEGLENLLDDVELTPAAAPESVRPPHIELPDKDRPILSAAVNAGATHLLTGDFRHFGPYYGEEIGGVLILPPADYLAIRPG